VALAVIGVPDAEAGFVGGDLQARRVVLEVGDGIGEVFQVFLVGVETATSGEQVAIIAGHSFGPPEVGGMGRVYVIKRAEDEGTYPLDVPEVKVFVGDDRPYAIIHQADRTDLGGTEMLQAARAAGPTVGRPELEDVPMEGRVAEEGDLRLRDSLAVV